MCYNRHHVIVTTIESVNQNGDRHRIYTQLVQYSQIVIFFFSNLPTDLVHGIRAHYSANC